MTNIASRELEAVLREQDREALTRLRNYKPEGPLDEAATNAAIENLIARLERTA